MVVVYYDLETTGLNNRERQKGVQIVSIGAVTENGATFHRYIIPTCEISRGATNIHGIYKEDGLLFKDGIIKQNALDPHSGLSCFMDWLASRNVKLLVNIISIIGNEKSRIFFSISGRSVPEARLCS